MRQTGICQPFNASIAIYKFHRRMPKMSSNRFVTTVDIFLLNILDLPLSQNRSFTLDCFAVALHTMVAMELGPCLPFGMYIL